MNCTQKIDQKQQNSAEHDAMIWRENAADLAEHLFSLGIFNRLDARGAYGTGGTFTRKNCQSGWTPNDQMTLHRHFGARRLRDIAGVHSTDPATGTCRWGAIDIDAHGENDGTDVAAENLRRAITMQDVAADMGIRLHLFSSNGIAKGGIHAWSFFDRPVPSEWMFAMLQKIVDGQRIETFPKQPSIPPTGYGNWIRLFGRHYKRPAWAKYWGGRGWLTAEHTIGEILKIEPDPANRVPEVRHEIRISSRPLYNGHRSHFAKTSDTLASWLESHGVIVKAQKPCPDGSVKLILGLCPFNPDHGDGQNDTSVCVFWTSNGPRFCCQHNRCRDYKWRDLRAMIDHDYVPNFEMTSVCHGMAVTA